MSASAVPSSGSVGWPAARSRANTSRAAKTVTTATAAASSDAAEGEDDEEDRDEDGGADRALAHPCPAYRPNRRWRRANSSRASSKASGPKSGQRVVAEVELGVGRLPDEEVREALLAAGPDDEVGVGQAGRVQGRG